MKKILIFVFILAMSTLFFSVKIANANTGEQFYECMPGTLHAVGTVNYCNVVSPGANASGIVESVHCNGDETTSPCVNINYDHWQSIAEEWSARWNTNCMVQTNGMPGVNPSTGTNFYYTTVCPDLNPPERDVPNQISNNPVTTQTVRQTTVQTTSKTTDNSAMVSYINSLISNLNKIITTAKNSYNPINSISPSINNNLTTTNVNNNLPPTNPNPVNPIVSNTTTPLFTSNTTSVMKVGDNWNIVITGLKPNEIIYATGGKKVNGVVPGDRTPYTASSLGIFFKNGIHTADVVGDWQLTWTRADGTVLKTLVFSVVSSDASVGVATLTISPKQTTVAKGLDFLFHANYSPDGKDPWTDVTSSALWYSSDEKIAEPLTMGPFTTRNGYRGEFRTLATGGVTVTATYKDVKDTASLIVSDSTMTSTTPLFTSNTTSVMKVGDNWNIVITGLKPNEIIYATGGKKVNGVVPGDRTPYTASSLGIFFKNGIHTADVVGDWQLTWTRADGTVLKTLVFSVVQ